MNGKRVFITHTGVDAGSVAALRARMTELKQFDEIMEVRAGCSITSHCGQGTLGILFIRN